MSKYFQNQTAFVFGGSEGIGLATAEELVKLGCSVVLFSRSSDKLDSAKAQLVVRHPKAQVQTIPCDVTNYEEVASAVEKACSSTGTPFFVMNFAGIAKPGFIDELDLKDFRQMIELNYMGTIHVVKALSKKLIAQKKGHVVTCSSMAGYLGLFGYTGYSASKFAVIGFSEALRREWAPYNIRVSVVCPPNTKTPGLEEENKSKPKEILAVEEKATPVDPEFVARKIVKGLSRQDYMILPTFDSRLANLLTRVSPRIIDFFASR